jgi:hypothetical protein
LSVAVVLAGTWVAMACLRSALSRSSGEAHWFYFKKTN